MRKYISFFRLRFLTGLQYRGAALAGITTQFFWGAMQLLMFKAFYQADSSAFPMTLPALSSYIWMQQAFLALFMVWFLENEVFDMISNGNIAYELCRPIDLYDLWFVRSVANRMSKWVLRSVPILLFATFVPYPYGLSLPKIVSSFFWFFITMILGFLLVIAFTM
jgi:ABC-2 type transport system permease protein